MKGDGVQDVSQQRWSVRLYVCECTYIYNRDRVQVTNGLNRGGPEGAEGRFSYVAPKSEISPSFDVIPEYAFVAAIAREIPSYVTKREMKK